MATNISTYQQRKVEEAVKARNALQDFICIIEEDYINKHSVIFYNI